MFLLDLLFPVATKNLPQTITYKPFQKEYNSQYLDKVYVMVNYSDEYVHELIHRIKQLGEFSLAGALSEVFINQFQKLELVLDNERTLVTFVPFDKKRMLQRGFHLPTMLAKNLSKYTNINCIQLLEKNKPTKKQTISTRLERMTNLQRCFNLINEDKLQNIHNLLLIDDITTTGATFVECAKVIKQKYPNIKIIALALASN